MTSMTGYRGPTGNPRGYSATGDVIPKGYKSGQLEQLTPEQMELFKSLFSQVSPESYLSKLAGGDEDLFQEMEEPAHRKFNEKLGQIGTRFSAMGTGGLKSSAFQNATTSAASNFSQDLSSRRQELQRQAIMDLMGLSESLLNQRPYDRFLAEKPQKQNNQFGDIFGNISQMTPYLLSLL